MFQPDNKFSYGIAFNLTFLEQLDTWCLKGFGMNAKQRDALLEKTYFIKEDESVDEDTAAVYARFTEKDTNGNLLVEGDYFLYSSVMTVRDTDYNIAVTGYEIIHAANSNHISARNEEKINKAAAIMGGAIESLPFGGAPVLGNLVQFAVGHSLRSANNYSYEVKSYEYQEKLSCMTDTRKRFNEVSMVQKNLEMMKKNISFGKKLVDRYVTGYPSSEKIVQIALENHLSLLKHPDDYYDKYKIRDLHVATRQNIANKKFNIVEL